MNRSIPSAILALAAMAGLWAWPVGAAAGPSDAGTPVPADKAAASEFEGFPLPADYKNADGTFNQDAIVAQQKKRLATIRRKLLVPFVMAETPHYLIFTSADADITDRFVRWSEALYADLGRRFGIDPAERIWDGKCLLLVFNHLTTFQNYARTFDRHDVAGAGAYFVWENNPPDKPQLVHLCIPEADQDPRRLRELFIHEATHAFFQLYKKAATLPLWLHEGLAEYMTVANDGTLGPKKLSRALNLSRQQANLKPIFHVTPEKGFSLSEYSVAYSLVEFLLSSGRPQFKAFIDALKEGQDQDAALKAAYGFDTSGLVSRWQVYMTKYTQYAP
jgi:hypothetical protein